MTPRYYGAVEAGGTKFVCAFVTGAETPEIVARQSFPTTTPLETLEKCKAFFEKVSTTLHTPVAIGIASFGPVNLDPASAEYGCIFSTPKQGWNGTNLKQYFESHLSVPTYMETDVGAALYAEHQWGRAQNLKNAVYVTIGTGVGAGIMANGAIIHGLIHPEIGHIPLPRHSEDADFESICPFHDDCLEGLASGPSIQARWGSEGYAGNLADNHPAWDMEAWYLAQMCRSITYMVSPERIILGGGVMKKSGITLKIHRFFTKLTNGYLPIAQASNGLENYIVTPRLGDNAGVLGAALCAMTAHID